MGVTRRLKTPVNCHGDPSIPVNLESLSTAEFCEGKDEVVALSMQREAVQCSMAPFETRLPSSNKKKDKKGKRPIFLEKKRQQVERRAETPPSAMALYGYLVPGDGRVQLSQIKLFFSTILFAYSRRGGVLFSKRKMKKTAAVLQVIFHSAETSH